MTQQDIAAMRAEADRIHARYDAHFAGQPRISRDPTLLDEMVASTDALLPRARAAGPDADALVATLEKNRTLYIDEANAVRSAQAAPPEVLAGHELGTWAQLTFNRYRRHFAGKARATRDLGLLGEMIAELTRIEGALKGLGARLDGPASSIESTLEQATSSRELYERERGAIRTARGAGTLDEQGDILATVANDQFALYKGHFAGKSRLSRRPALMERMVDSLGTVLERMRALQTQGLHAEGNTRNIGIVEARLTLYRQELDKIREARQGSSLSQLVSAFGEAANKVFEAYREGFAGKDRKTRDPEALSVLCDALYDLARQMDDLDRVREDETNQHNLAVVLDQLRLYEREYGLIVEARSDAG